VGSPDVLQGFVRCSCLSDAGLHVCICSSLLVYQAPKVCEGLDLLQVVVSQLHSLCAGGVDLQCLVGMDLKSDLGGVGGQVVVLFCICCRLWVRLFTTRNRKDTTMYKDVPPMVGEQSKVALVRCFCVE
jgi:hypothetical protein